MFGFRSKEREPRDTKAWCPAVELEDSVAIVGFERRKEEDFSLLETKRKLASAKAVVIDGECWTIIDMRRRFMPLIKEIEKEKPVSVVLPKQELISSTRDIMRKFILSSNALVCGDTETLRSFYGTPAGFLNRLRSDEPPIVFNESGRTVIALTKSTPVITAASPVSNLQEMHAKKIFAANYMAARLKGAPIRASLDQGARAAG